MKKTINEKIAMSEKEYQHKYNKKYYAEHKENELLRVREYKKQHKEELREKNKEYRERNKDRIKAYRDTPEMKQYQREYQKMYREKKKAEAEKKTQVERKEMCGQIEEFVANSLEVVKILDCILDLDEKELDVCTDKQHRNIMEVRNILAETSNRLVRIDEEQPKKDENVTLAYWLSEDEDDVDEGAIYIKRNKNMDNELGR